MRKVELRFAGLEVESTGRDKGIRQTLAPSIQVEIGVNGRMSARGPAPAATAAAATSPTGFTGKPSVEGPLAEAGLALAATALAATAAERAWGSEKAVRGRADGR
jgi:hypothetical protein